MSLQIRYSDTQMGSYEGDFNRCHSGTESELLDTQDARKLSQAKIRIKVRKRCLFHCLRCSISFLQVALHALMLAFRHLPQFSLTSTGWPPLVHNPRIENPSQYVCSSRHTRFRWPLYPSNLNVPPKNRLCNHSSQSFFPNSILSFLSLFPHPLLLPLLLLLPMLLAPPSPSQPDICLPRLVLGCRVGGEGW